jgi:hypothetical protein
MIVCHCNVIADAELIDVIDQLLAAERWQLITPVMVYHELGKRGRCCGCFPTVVDLIIERTRLARGEENLECILQMAGEWKRNERRSRRHQSA